MFSYFSVQLSSYPCLIGYYIKRGIHPALIFLFLPIYISYFFNLLIEIYGTMRDWEIEWLQPCISFFLFVRPMLALIWIFFYFYSYLFFLFSIIQYSCLEGLQGKSERVTNGSFPLIFSSYCFILFVCYSIHFGRIAWKASERSGVIGWLAVFRIRILKMRFLIRLILDLDPSHIPEIIRYRM